MSSFTNRGRALYNDVLKLEQTIFTDQNAGKKIQQLKLRLEAIINDFDRQAETLLEKIPSNQKGIQNIINIRSKKVKKVKVAEMNGAISKLRKLASGNTTPSTSVSASESPITPPAGAQQLESAFEKLDERLKTVGSRFQN